MELYLGPLIPRPDTLNGFVDAPGDPACPHTARHCRCSDRSICNNAAGIPDSYHDEQYRLAVTVPPNVQIHATICNSGLPNASRSIASVSASNSGLASSNPKFRTTLATLA